MLRALQSQATSSRCASRCPPDGVSTILGAIFGSVFGRTVYIGHPAYKKMGAGVGYSVVNEVGVALLCITGLAAPLFTLIELASVQPIILFVGFLIGAQALEIAPPRHYPAVLIGLLPSMADWAKSTLMDSPTLSKGFEALGTGALLNGIVISSLLIAMIDRKMLVGAAWSGIGAFLSFFGIVHAAEIKAMTAPNAMGWRFSVGHTQVSISSMQLATLSTPPASTRITSCFSPQLGVFFLFLELLQRKGKIDGPNQATDQVQRSSLAGVGGVETMRRMSAAEPPTDSADHKDKSDQELPEVPTNNGDFVVNPASAEFA